MTVACSAPRHYFEQWSTCNKWAFGIKCQRYFNSNTTIYIRDKNLKKSFAKWWSFGLDLNVLTHRRWLEYRLGVVTTPELSIYYNPDHVLCHMTMLWRGKSYFSSSLMIYHSILRMRIAIYLQMTVLCIQWVNQQMKTVGLCKNLFSRQGSGSIITTFLLISLKLYQCMLTSFSSNLNKIADADNILNLSLQDAPLSQVRDCRYLGIQLDQCLKWDAHVLNLCEKFASKLSVLNKLRSILSKEMLSRQYLLCIQPCIDYAISVWGTCSKQLKDMITRL